VGVWSRRRLDTGGSASCRPVAAGGLGRRRFRFNGTHSRARAMARDGGDVLFLLRRRTPAPRARITRASAAVRSARPYDSPNLPDA